MAVDFLVLSWSEAIDIAEKVIGLEQVILLHLFGREQEMVGYLFDLHKFHCNSKDGRGEWVKRR